MVLSVIIMSLSSFGGKLGKNGLYWSSGTDGSVLLMLTRHGVEPGLVHDMNQNIGSFGKAFCKTPKTYL